MASYFRSAAQCDRTIAAKAPVPIYNIPPIGGDDGDSTVVGDDSSAAAIFSSTTKTEDAVLDNLPNGDVNKMQLSDRMGFQQLTGTSLIRAQLDHTSMASKRVHEKRDAKVLAKEAAREHRLNLRLQDEAARNDRLLDQIKIEREEARAVAARDAVEAGQKAQAKLDAEAAVSPFRKLQQKQQSTSGEDELTKAVIDTSKIDLFEKIRLEEERYLRHQHTDGAGNNKGAGANGGLGATGGGGIIGMYNNIALSRAMEDADAKEAQAIAGASGDDDDVDHVAQKEPKPFPTDFTSGKADAPIGFIPTDINALVRDGTGQDRAKTVLDRTRNYDKAIDRTFTEYREGERRDVERVVEYKQRHDRERSQMLTEEVAQDNARQRERNENRDAQLRLTHPSTFAESYGPNAGDVVRGQVVSRHSRHANDERSLLGYDGTSSGSTSHVNGGPVYVHPIDMYQKLVREDMMRAQQEDDESRVALALERM